MIKKYIIFTIICTVWYGLGAFVAADINAAHWPAEGRYFIACGWLFIFLGLAVSEYSDK